MTLGGMVAAPLLLATRWPPRVARRPIGGFGRPLGLTRPTRVVTCGRLTAVALTVPRRAPGYQQALAHHLADTGAIMYGAFR